MVPSELPIGSVLCSTKTRDVWSRSFRTYFVLSSFIEHDDQAKYVKRHASYIETTDQLFEYLSLAELDEESPLGWRPTPVLLYLMDEQAARKSKPNRRPISMQGRLLCTCCTMQYLVQRATAPVS